MESRLVEQVEVEEKGRITIVGVGRRRDRMIGVELEWEKEGQGWK